MLCSHCSRPLPVPTPCAPCHDRGYKAYDQLCNRACRAAVPLRMPAVARSECLLAANFGCYCKLQCTSTHANPRSVDVQSWIHTRWPRERAHLLTCE